MARASPSQTVELGSCETGQRRSRWRGLQRDQLPLDATERPVVRHEDVAAHSLPPPRTHLALHESRELGWYVPSMKHSAVVSDQASELLVVESCGDMCGCHGSQVCRCAPCVPGAIADLWTTSEDQVALWISAFSRSLIRRRHSGKRSGDLTPRPPAFSRLDVA